MSKTKILVAVLMIAVFVLSPEFAQVIGQQPRTSAQNQVDSGEVVRLLQVGAPDEAGKATVTAYLTSFFAQWRDPNNATELGRYRKEIQTIVDNVSNPQGKEYLLGMLTNGLANSYVNNKNLYAACRYNAVLALGDLDTGQANGIPVPYPRALEALYKIYDPLYDLSEDEQVSKRVENEQDPAREAVRLGALLGIRRHVVLGIANAQTRDGRIAPLLMKIAADTPYIKDDSGTAEEDDDVVVLSITPNAVNTSEKQRTVELHNWFRTNAIETLGHLSGASQATQNEIVNTLLARIQDDAELPSIRYLSAYSLSRFNKTIESSPNDLLKRTTQALLTLGLVVHDDGIMTMMEEQSTTQTVGSMQTGSMGGAGGGMSEMGMGMGMGSGGTSSSAGQTQADQINNSLIQIKDGFSSINACILGPDFRSGGLMNSDTVKNTPYHPILLGLNKTIAECVKFLDDGDPAAKQRVQATSDLAMGMEGMGTGSGAQPTATAKNQPKVSMKEIEDRLKIAKKNIEDLQNVLRSLDAGLMTASQ